MDEGSTVAIEQMDWTDPSEDDTYADPRIWISGCGDVGHGNFYVRRGRREGEWMGGRK
jgi:hypothetical protein